MCSGVCPCLFCELTSPTRLDLSGDLAITNSIRGKWPFWVQMWSAVLPFLGSCIHPRPQPRSRVRDERAAGDSVATLAPVGFSEPGAVNTQLQVGGLPTVSSSAF
jgi:hypothetical protein